MILAGPGVEAKGISPAFAFVTDLVPTILELTGTRDATPPGKHPIDGRSLTPALRDPSGLIHPPQEATGFETAGHGGVFKGDHKLVRVGAPAGDGRWRLFDLAEDPGETRDLATPSRSTMSMGTLATSSFSPAAGARRTTSASRKIWAGRSARRTLVNRWSAVCATVRWDCFRR